MKGVEVILVILISVVLFFFFVFWVFKWKFILKKVFLFEKKE